jgi:aldehyde:ferredoxin oxidoreductase
LNGYLGKILTVDLTEGKIAEEQLNAEYARSFIGGSGLAARYVYDLTDGETDPLGPENPLMFMTGPLVGTRAPSSHRYVICARSPQTGFWGESNIGGFLGPQIRYAGYDGIILRGQSAKPVYLSIEDGNAEVRPASHLWGLGSYQTQEEIRKELGDKSARVACIGQAGEKLVKYAAVMADQGRAAGRSGMGAVMGSKRLKAVACRGKGSIPLADREAFDSIAQETLDYVKEDVSTQIFNQTGTSGGANFAGMQGNMPNKYFTQGTFDEVDNISGSTIAETILAGTSGCSGCVVQCGRQVEIPEGPYRLEETDGPEYETVAALGSVLLIDDLAAVTYMGYLCNAYGLDTISTGVVLGLAFHLYERGVIGSDDTGGLGLRWGDPEPAIRLIEMIAQREGFGDLLAEGALALGRHYGVEEMAVHVQGLEVPMHDPRADASVALCYLTSPRGACHNKSDTYWLSWGRIAEELNMSLADRFEEEGKAAMVAHHQNWRSVCDALVSCFLVNLTADGLLDMLNAATGQDFSLETILPVGERIFNMKRALNIRWGWNLKDENLPPLLLQPLEDGGTGGYVPNVDKLLSDYYRVRKWDGKTGKPTREKLLELNLADVVDELY